MARPARNNISTVYVICKWTVERGARRAGCPRCSKLPMEISFGVQLLNERIRGSQDPPPPPPPPGLKFETFARDKLQGRWNLLYLRALRKFPLIIPRIRDTIDSSLRFSIGQELFMMERVIRDNPEYIRRSCDSSFFIEEFFRFRNCLYNLISTRTVYM